MVKNCLLKKLKFPAFAFLLFTSLQSEAQLNPAVGQGKWKYTTPSPLGFSMSDMSFADNNTGLVVGVSGGLARTTDAGLNWSFIPFKFVNNANTVTLASFNDVQFATTSVAYAVGTGGLMIKSTDGGLNWTAITTPLTPKGLNINALHFLNKDTGYIGGQSITSGNTTSIDDVPKVYFTRNGGATWDSLASPFTPAQNTPTLNWNNQKEIQRIHFANDSVGYVVGSSGNNFTGGQSGLIWKIKKNVVTDFSMHRSKFGLTTGNHTPSVQQYKGVVAINDTLALVSSLNNNLVVRVKTGVNDSTANAVPAVYGNYTKGILDIVVWLASTATPFPASLSGAAGQMQHLKRMPDGKIAMTMGNSIAFTPDNGTTWSFTKPTPATLSYAHWGFSALDITPNGRIVTAGFNGQVMDSLPGTTTWRTSYANIRPLFHSFVDMDWADCNNGIIVGSNGTFIKTTDGGRTWVNNSNPVFEAAQISISWVTYHAANSMFFSAGKSVYKTADQGTTNDVIFTDPHANANGLQSFTMVGQNRAFAIGSRFSPAVERTLIYRSLNANAASPVWDTVKAVFPKGTLAPTLRNIKFANQDTGYVCGSRGKVYRTIDGGNSWTDISPDTTVNSNGTATYTGLAVVTGKVVYVSGSSRKLFKSTDAGATWTDLSLSATTTPIVLSSFASLGTIIMNDENSGYIASGQTLLKTTDGWASWTYDMAPGSMQNISMYPKAKGPIDSKKIYGMFMTVGFPGPISTQSAVMVEYGNAATYNVSTTEVITPTCPNSNDGTITITATGGIAPYTYSVDGSPFQLSNLINGLSLGNHTIVIKDAGCQTISKTVAVGVKPNLTVNAGPDKTIVQGDAVVLEGSSPAQVATITWTPAATLSGATTFRPTAKPDVTTTYTLSVKDVNGCTGTDNAVVNVIPYCLKAMDAFTPNGDGINDKWLVTQGGSCTSQVTVTVFNRYGSAVYKNDHYQNDWDGTYSGKPVADGTYYYTIVYKLVNGKSVTQKGNLTILR